MKQVFLTSGPRGGGKSTYVEELCRRRPDLTLVSRDQVMLELFGTVWFGAYSGGADHDRGMQEVWRRLEVALKPEGACVVFDCWNGFPADRRWLIEKLRELGADQVICLQFFVSVETCVRWYMRKPEQVRGGLSESSIRCDYRLYYGQAQSIGQDGFDHVIEVRPEEPELFDLIP